MTLKTYRITGLLSIYTAVICWAFTGILGKLISLNASSIIWWRLFLCSVILLIFFHKSVYLFFKRHPNNFKLTVIAGIILYFHWICFYQSIKLSNVSIGVVCLSLIPFCTCFADYILTGKKLRKDHLILSLLVVACIVIIFGFEYQYRNGIIIGLIGAFIDAFYIIITEKTMKTEKALNVLTVQFTSALILHTVLIGGTLLTFPDTFVNTFLHLQMLEQNNFMWMFILVVPCTLGSFYLALNSLKTIPAFTQTIILSFEPIIGIVFSIFLLHENEQLSSYFYIGLICLTLLVTYQTYKTYSMGKTT